MFNLEVLHERFKYPFSPQSIDVLNFAEQEARGLNHNYIGTEHLLLGLIRNGVPQYLEKFGIGIVRARTAVEFVIGRGEGDVLENRIDLSLRSKSAIAWGIDEALEVGKDNLLPDHLWFGLLREGEGMAIGILEGLGVNTESMRLTISRYNRLGSEVFETVDQARSAMERLQFFLDDPRQYLARKQQIAIVLEEALGLITPSTEQK